MKKFLFVALPLILTACAKKDVLAEAEATETAQQIGDVMASIDESGKSSGDITSYNNSIQKTFARYHQEADSNSTAKNLVQIFQPKALATACTGYGYDTCGTTTANKIVRTFNGCTVGNAIFTGTVILTWSGASANCILGGTGDTITRVPSFSVTGLRGATLAVSKTGTYGQKITYTSAGSPRTFTFDSDGINRKFTLASGTVLLNQTTTATGISISGNVRTGRTLSGGLLTVTNNVTGDSCNFNPVAVTWTAGCNCPTSGTWNGTCTGGKTSTVVINGCGTGTYSEGTTSTTVTFDRCGT